MLTTAGTEIDMNLWNYEFFVNAFTGIMSMGVIADMSVVYYAKDLKIFDEDDKTKIIQTKL